MRLIGFVALLIVLFTSLFHLWGADLTNNVLGVTLMVFLASVFSDLSEFNFWGLRGRAKEEKKLKELKGEEAIVQKAPRIGSSTVQKVLRQDTVVLMDTERGNFLALAFDIERLLRIAAALVEGIDDPTSINPNQALDILRQHAVLTPAGQEQIEAIRWLRNMIVQGREHELASDTMTNGTELAFDLYKDLKKWLDETQTPQKDRNS